MCRYGLSGWITRSHDHPSFPVGILVVNLLGCLLIGIALGLVEARDLFSHNIRLLVSAGFLGGFTTFSTFGADTFLLLRGGQAGYALANVLLSILGGVLAAWTGFFAAFKLSGGTAPGG